MPEKWTDTALYAGRRRIYLWAMYGEGIMIQISYEVALKTMREGLRSVYEIHIPPNNAESLVESISDLHPSRSYGVEV